MRKIFWSFAVTIFIAFFALVTCYQLKEFQRIDFKFSIPFSMMLAVVGGGIAAIAVTSFRKKDEEIATYQSPGEPETKGILKFAFVGEKLQFKSEVPTEIAVVKLKKEIVETPFLFWTFPENAVIGKVSLNRVKLIYATAGMRNSFNPIFVGKFQQNGSGSVLCGTYRMHRFVTVFLCVWFGGLAGGSTIAVTTLILDSKGKFFSTPAWIGALLFIVFPLLMGAGGLGLVAFGKRVARASLHHLTETIEKSIGKQSA